MIVAIIISSFIILFILFNFILIIFPHNKKETYLNIERAEEYIYSKTKYQYVFVGSGLIGDLKQLIINKDNIFNLFLPYSSSCTGVEIIAKSNKIPNVLFIEINYIFKGTDTELTTKLFNKKTYKIKRILPCLLHKNKPQQLIKTLLKKTIKSKYIQTNKQTTKHYINKEISIKETEINYNLFLNNKLEDIITNLDNYLQLLKSKGCQIIFFEIPIDKQLAIHPLLTKQKELILNLIKTRNYTYIQDNSLYNYETVDGIHLTKNSALIFFKNLGRIFEKNHDYSKQNKNNISPKNTSLNKNIYLILSLYLDLSTLI